MAQEGFITCHGAQIFYEMAGSGETIVFVHGFPLDSRMWEPQMAVLSSQYRVLRFDMRGMGQSANPGGSYTLYEDLHDLLQQLNIPRASLVGASFGSYACIEFALAYPELVDRLILLCPGGFLPPSDEWQQKLQDMQEQLQKGNLEEALDITLHITLDGFHQQSGRVQSRRQWLSDIYREIYTRPTVTGMPTWLEPDPRSRLSEVSAPALIVSGELDHADFLLTAESLVNQISDVQQIFLKNSAHFPNIDSPQEVNALIHSFISGSLGSTKK
ncbi:alpha/beta hydrolase [Brevibacillus nitrificans]|uniref:alpha/beta fold hydrolase n=1 Tax=Brevibacillus nitrificans TaxID=651560 RepID=UPI002E242924|nr:alpha/beta hydrolase [Brevibacillus nitrificans]